jgi:hypothetical protein
MSQLVAASKNSFHDIPVVKNIGGKNVESYNNTSCYQRRVFVQVSPSTAISSNVLQGAQLDFRIKIPLIGLDQHTLELIGLTAVEVISSTRVQQPCGFNKFKFMPIMELLYCIKPMIPSKIG